jgi:hypothetical protein
MEELGFYGTLDTFYDNVSRIDEPLLIFSLYRKFLKTILLPQYSVHSAQQFCAQFTVGFSVCVCETVPSISTKR